jgi:hypothetical protein
VIHSVQLGAALRQPEQPDAQFGGYQILHSPDFDGDWNWDSLTAHWDMAKELLYEYKKGQEKLYPGLKIINEEGSD